LVLTELFLFVFAATEERFVLFVPLMEAVLELVPLVRFTLLFSAALPRLLADTPLSFEVTLLALIALFLLLSRSLLTRERSFAATCVLLPPLSETIVFLLFGL
jgi:hypothetical protein